MHVVRSTNRPYTCCKISLAFVNDGTISHSVHYLIQPPENLYESPYPIGVHPDQTKDSPLFSEIWEEIRELINGEIIVVYNSGNQMSTLRRTVEYNLLVQSECEFICARSIALKTVMDCVDFSFDTIARHLYPKHDFLHSDSNGAISVANILLEENKLLETNDKYDYPIVPGYMSFCKWKACNVLSERKLRNKNEFYIPNSETFNPNSYFYEKVVSATLPMKLQRSEIGKMIIDIGGQFRDSYKADVEILIIGEADESKKGSITGKITKIEEKRKKGADIEIMYEHDFWDIINNEKHC